MRIIELFETHTGFQLFVDLDGVLADFDSGKNQIIKGTPSEKQKSEFWKTLHSFSYEEIEDWWANLGMAPGGEILWSYVSKFHPIILSSPDISKGCREACEKGKLRWIKKHLHPSPSSVIITKDKWKHASRFNILIDDRTKVLIPWEEHGGVGIHYETGNPKKTIKELIDRFGFPKK